MAERYFGLEILGVLAVITWAGLLMHGYLTTRRVRW